MSNSETLSPTHADIALAYLKAFNRLVLAVFALSVVGAATGLGFISVETITLPFVGQGKIQGESVLAFATLVTVFLISVAIHGYYIRFSAVMRKCDSQTRRLICHYPTFFTLPLIPYYLIFIFFSIALGIAFVPAISIFTGILWSISVFSFGGICNVIRSDIAKDCRKANKANSGDGK